MDNYSGAPAQEQTIRHHFKAAINLLPDVAIPTFISLLIYFPIIYFKHRNGGAGAPWVYVHFGDAGENIRTAYLGTWGYSPIKDIAINHMPGAPEILRILNIAGNFLTQENNIAATHIIREGSYAATLCFQTATTYFSARLFLNKLLGSITTILLISWVSTNLFYYAPLSETMIPFLMIAWGSIWIKSTIIASLSSGKANWGFEQEYAGQLILLIMIIWIGLTSPFAYIALWLSSSARYISRAYQAKKTREGIRKWAKITLFFAFAAALIAQAAYGLENIFKWVVLANKIHALSPEMVTNNLIHNFLSARINFLHSAYTITLFTGICLVSFRAKLQLLISAECSAKAIQNTIKQANTEILVYLAVALSAYFADGWRVSANSMQGYKTEASWGLIAPIIFVVIALLCTKARSASKRDATNPMAKSLGQIAIITAISCLIATFITCNMLQIAHRSLSKNEWSLLQEQRKPTLEKASEIMTRNNYLRNASVTTCALVDSWDPEFWFRYNAQPCLGVFMNSIPRLTKIEPFRKDLENKIKTTPLVIAAMKDTGSGLWPIYTRQYKNLLKCNDTPKSMYTQICRIRNFPQGIAKQINKA